MATDVSIAISAKDNYTQVIQKIEAATKTFATDISGLQGKLDKLNKTRASLQINVTEARNRVRELTREMNANGAASDETKRKLQEAEEEYQTYASALREVQTQAKETERSIRNLNGTAGKGGGGNSTDSALNAAAVMNMVNSGVGFVSGLVSTELTTSGQPEAATMWNDIISGIMSGASIGSVGGFGWGTVIGGVAGGLTGIIKGFSDINATETEAFSSVLQTQFNDTTEAVDAYLTSGSALAGQREKDRIAFAKMLGGENEADSYLQAVIEKANTTPFLYDDLKTMSKTLATFGYSPDEMLSMIDKVGDAGAALGMDANGMTAVATYLGRMKSSGKTTLEYINPLIERGIPVMDYLAESLGKSKTEVYDMVSKGLIPGEEAARVIADYMGTDFSGAMSEMSKTYSGLSSTVEGWEQEMQNAMGEGYNKAKIPMLEEQIAWYEKNGEKMKQVYYKIGQTNAEAENEGTRAKLAAWDDIIANYDNLNGGELRAKLAEAENAEYVAYMESEGYKQIYEAENWLIKQLANDLAPVWAQAGYDQGKIMAASASAAIDTFTRSFGINTNGEVSLVEVEDLINMGVDPYKALADPNTPRDDDNNIILQTPTPTPNAKHAFGFSYVPYDDYPAILHQGERVLTASQNREYSRNMGGVSVVMNGVTVREEADIDRIADELYFRIRAAAANYSEVD